MYISVSRGDLGRPASAGSARGAGSAASSLCKPVVEEAFGDPAFEKEQQQAVEQRFEGVEERAAAWSVLDNLRQESSSLPQSAFRWVLADERVSTVSSGAADIAQLQEVAQAGDMEPLAIAFNP